MEAGGQWAEARGAVAGDALAGDAAAPALGEAPTEGQRARPSGWRLRASCLRTVGLGLGLTACFGTGDAPSERETIEEENATSPAEQVPINTADLSAFGEVCAGDEDCASGVCFIGGQQSFCSSLCNPELAEKEESNPDCASQEGASGQCNTKGFCKPGQPMHEGDGNGDGKGDGKGDGSGDGSGNGL